MLKENQQGIIQMEHNTTRPANQPICPSHNPTTVVVTRTADASSPTENRMPNGISMKAKKKNGINGSQHGW